MSGVETNECSRFIDHTMATPWEVLISDLEKIFDSLRNTLQASPEDLLVPASHENWLCGVRDLNLQCSNAQRELEMEDPSAIADEPVSVSNTEDVSKSPQGLLNMAFVSERPPLQWRFTYEGTEFELDYVDSSTAITGDAPVVGGIVKVCTDVWSSWIPILTSSSKNKSMKGSGVTTGSAISARKSTYVRIYPVMSPLSPSATDIRAAVVAAVSVAIRTMPIPVPLYVLCSTPYRSKTTVSHTISCPSLLTALTVMNDPEGLSSSPLIVTRNGTIQPIMSQQITETPTAEEVLAWSHASHLSASHRFGGNSSTTNVATTNANIFQHSFVNEWANSELEFHDRKQQASLNAVPTCQGVEDYCCDSHLQTLESPLDVCYLFHSLSPFFRADNCVKCHHAHDSGNNQGALSFVAQPMRVMPCYSQLTSLGRQLVRENEDVPITGCDMLIGYEHISIPPSVDPYHQLTAVGKLWQRTESSVFPRLTPQHPLFFFDGIRKLFLKRLILLGLVPPSVIVNGVSSTSSAVSIPPGSSAATAMGAIEEFRTTVTHFYRYPTALWSALPLTSDSSSNTFNNAQGNGTGTNVTLPEGFLVQTRMRAEEVALSNSLHSLTFRSVVSALIEGVTRLPFTSLDELSVQLEYRQLRPQGIIDNELYSTLLPARLSPANWRLKARYSAYKCHPCGHDAVGVAMDVFATTRDGRPELSSRTSHSLLHGNESLTTNVGQMNGTGSPVSPIPLLHTAWCGAATQKLLVSFLSVNGLRDDRGGVLLASHFSEAQERLTPSTLSSVLQCVSSSLSVETLAALRDLMACLSNSSTASHNYVNETRVSSTTSSVASINLQSTMETSRVDIFPVLVSLLCADTPIATRPSTESCSNGDTIASSLGVTEGTLRSLSMMAGLVCDSTSICEMAPLALWRRFVSELQSRYDRNAPLVASPLANPFMKLPAELAHITDLSPLASDDSKPSRLSSEALWMDMLRPFRSAGIPVRVPDSRLSPLVQCLDTIQLCTAASAIEVPHIAHLPLTTSNDVPALCRRLPITASGTALQRHIARKMAADTSHTLRGNPLLRYSSVLPSVLSDARALKAAKAPHVPSFEEFCEWYGVSDVLQSTDVPNTVENVDCSVDALFADVGASSRLRELYTEAEPEVAESQAPLFSADKEFARTIATLDRMPLVIISAELLRQSLLFSAEHHMTLISTLEKQTSFGPAAEAAPRVARLAWKVCVSLLTPICQSLHQQLEAAADALLQSINDISPSEQRPLAIACPEIVAIVDQAVVALLSYEARLSRTLQSLAPLAASVATAMAQTEADDETICESLSHFISSIGNGSSASLSTVQEVTALRRVLATLSVCSGRGHAWHSADGRELGVPHGKRFILETPPLATVPSGSDNSSTRDISTVRLVAHADTSKLRTVWQIIERD